MSRQYRRKRCRAAGSVHSTRVSVARTVLAGPCSSDRPDDQLTSRLLRSQVMFQTLGDAQEARKVDYRAYLVRGIDTQAIRRGTFLEPREK